MLSAPSCDFPAPVGQGEHFFDMQRRAMTGQSSEVIDLDLNDQICPRGLCLPEQNGIVTYSDTHHLTAAFVRSLAPILLERLDRARSHQRAGGMGVLEVP